MCGIVGIISSRQVTPLLVDGLKRLEYRGYDSAGVATLIDGKIQRRRAKGKIVNLENKIAEEPLNGTIGIAHTRWATHGVPNEANAHPHADKNVAVVHNGIIENYRELRAELLKKGHKFESETDTEVVVHLISQKIEEGRTAEQAVSESLKRLKGAFALSIIFTGREDIIIGARKGSPLAVGFGDGEMFLGSDALALAPLTKKIMYLEDGDWAVLTHNSATVYDENNNKVERKVIQSAASGAMIGKGEYRHFMLKEIYEQPQVIGDTLNTMINQDRSTITLPNIPFDLKDVSRLTIVACGTSYYAGLVGKYWIESVAKVPVDIDVASEFRYRRPVMQDKGVSLFISQSGETADTLAALRYCKEQGQKIVSIVNVDTSTMAREADCVLKTLAGPEIGVASTKAFTTQLTLLACFAIALGRAKGTLEREEEIKLSRALVEVPSRAAEVLNNDEKIEQIAQNLVSTARDVLYLGRGSNYPIALEGALKLKEISYIHAEGYAAGEMKHGPIALIDEDVPVIVVAPTDELFDKTISNMQEVLARGGKVVFFGDENGVGTVKDRSAATIILPTVNPFVAPILYAIPVQLLAYHTAIAKGTDVDQPRNLAKSVTVE
ncbi:MAG: glutamine--fructose-6-phosphate transaminase (isomerizing) [Alphaproteobacteria bacterium]|nr:glutamine--fructose-6-phosphate transaminase (isomerizing) [Alphaproteobacteria bacterium]